MARSLLDRNDAGGAGVLRAALRHRTRGVRRDAGESRRGRHKANFLEIFSPSMVRTTAFTCLLSTGAQGGYYSITTWLPTFLRTERKLTVLGTGGYLAVIIGAR